MLTQIEDGSLEQFLTVIIFFKTFWNSILCTLKSTVRRGIHLLDSLIRAIIIIEPQCISYSAQSSLAVRILFCLFWSGKLCQNTVTSLNEMYYNLVLFLMQLDSCCLSIELYMYYVLTETATAMFSSNQLLISCQIPL